MKLVLLLSLSVITPTILSCPMDPMPTRRIETPNAPQPIGPYSQAIETTAKKFVFVSGQIPVDPATGELKKDIKEATGQVMSNLKAILQAADLDFNDVVKTTIFLTDMKDFNAVNEVYATYFKDGGARPARETVQVAGLPRGANVEISMIAAKDSTPEISNVRDIS